MWYTNRVRETFCHITKRRRYARSERDGSTRYSFPLFLVQCGPFPSGFRDKIFYEFLNHTMRATCLARVFFIWRTLCLIKTNSTEFLIMHFSLPSNSGYSYKKCENKDSRKAILYWSVYFGVSIFVCIMIVFEKLNNFRFESPFWGTADIWRVKATLQILCELSNALVIYCLVW